MRDFILILSSALAASVFTFALAEHTANAGAHSAAVVADEGNGFVRIVIDGKDIVRVDADGLYVEGGIEATAGLRAPNVSGEPLPDTVHNGDTP